MISDVKYDTNGRQDIFAHLENVRGTCLEIGSGNGQFAKSILAKFPVDLYHAFEPAGTHHNDEHDRRLVVHNSYFTDSTSVYDFVFLNDVLEHMEDPASFLRRLRKSLDSKSTLIISVPNFRNIQILDQLLRGRIRYEDFGIMDKTHLRIFTRRIAIELLDSAGYDVSLLKPINKDLYIPQPSVAVQKFYRALSFCFHSLIPDLFYLQLLIVARPK